MKVSERRKQPPACNRLTPESQPSQSSRSCGDNETPISNHRESSFERYVFCAPLRESLPVLIHWIHAVHSIERPAAKLMFDAGQESRDSRSPIPLVTAGVRQASIKSRRRINMASRNLPGRRDVLKTLATAALAETLVDTGFSAQTKSGEMIYWPFGRTGEKVSALGLGGYPIAVPDREAEGVRIIRTAVDRGITFLDNCWDYNDGRSEMWMGKALGEGYRQKVFLMTKFDGRTKEAAARQIDESLKRLQTDHIDLIQFHENIRMNDPDRFFAPGGAVEAVIAAKKAGKVRYIGFTGHKDPSIHLKMLEVADQHKFHFDAAQMPLNVMDAQFRSFTHLVVPKLVEKANGRTRDEATRKWSHSPKRPGHRD